MLSIIRKSKGTALAVPDEDMIYGVQELGQTEGIFAAPEGGAVLAALKKMLALGNITSAEQIVLFNTGSGHKYVDNMETLL